MIVWTEPHLMGSTERTYQTSHQEQGVVYVSDSGQQVFFDIDADREAGREKELRFQYQLLFDAFE